MPGVIAVTRLKAQDSRSVPLGGELVGVAGEARRLGLIDLEQSGRMIDVSFPGWFTEQERERIRGT